MDGIQIRLIHFTRTKMNTEINGYELSRAWFDFCYENPEKIKPHHTALYFFIIEHCNRLGWKEKFGLPTTMAKEAIGIRSYNTYINTLRDLVEWKFVKMIEVSKNQYSSNIVALSSNVKALGKALDKALIKHSTKQGESTDSVNKQRTKNKKPINKEQELIFPFDSEEFKKQWCLWKDYKKDEHKFQYKTLISEQAALTELLNLSNGNEEIAVKIIHQSFANGYKGLFKLKTQNNGTGQPQGGKHSDDKLADALREQGFNNG